MFSRTVQSLSNVFGRLSPVKLFSHRKLHQGHGSGTVSFNGKTAVVFGGSSTMGMMIVNRLSLNGYQIICPHRCAWNRIKQILPSADYGKIILMEVDDMDDPRVRAAVNRADVVVNLIGEMIFQFTAYKCNVTVPTKIASMVAESPSVKSYIHYSLLNATTDTDDIIRKTKAIGEAEVKKIYPDVNIIRPANFYAYFSSFPQNYYNLRSFHRAVLMGLSDSVIKRPLFAADLSKATFNVLNNPHLFKGCTFEFYNDVPYYLSDIATYLDKLLFKKPTNLVCRFAAALPPHKFYVRNPKFAVLKGIPYTWLVSDFPSHEPNILKLNDAGVTPSSFERSIYDTVVWLRPYMTKPIDYYELNNTDMICPSVYSYQK